MKEDEDIKIVSKNRKAFHDFHILEQYEAGIVLTGTEVKSVRQANVNLKDSYATIKNSEVFLLNAHISPYKQGGIFNHDPTRERKLLLHRKEIDKLTSKIKERGFTLIPLKVYLKRGRVKIELGLARGKREYDKRADIAKKDIDREIRRAMKLKIRY